VDALVGDKLYDSLPTFYFVDDPLKSINVCLCVNSVYRRRGIAPPQAGTPQRLPKRLHFVLDVSGSMYRFNGSDQRLERLLECALLIMEVRPSLDSLIVIQIDIFCVVSLMYEIVICRL
jgi:hypothetical protein